MSIINQTEMSRTKSSPQYDLVVVGSGFAGSMTALNFLERCKALGKHGKVALIEAGKDGERCGGSRLRPFSWDA
ncbi:hypothetical protein RBB50_011398 [Rhinocladiella similis]